MDKRSLIFISLMATSLFFVNNWLSPPPPVKPQAETVTAIKGVTEFQVENLAPLLPSLYSPKNQNAPVVTAVGTTDVCLVIAPTKALPSELLVKDSNGATQFKPVSLVAGDPTHPGTPLLYASAAAKTSKTGKLPIASSLDDHITGVLYFDREDPILAKSTTCSASFTDLTFDGHPIGAIVFAKTSVGFLPFGMIDPITKKMKGIETLPHFAPYLQQESTYLADGPDGSKETFYVLENNSFQLVFSTLGGALAEINLPIKSKEFHPNSPILPIEIDTLIEQNDPVNYKFPLHPATFARNQSQKEGAYYPLLRRDILPCIDNQGEQIKAKSIPPAYYALSTMTRQSTEPDSFEMTDFSENSITFVSKNAFRKITKTFTINPAAPYLIDLDIKIDGRQEDLSLTTGVPEVELVSGNPAPGLKYRILSGKAKVADAGLPKEGKGPIYQSLAPDWISNSNGFFGIIINPVSRAKEGFTRSFVPGEVAPSRISLIDTKYERYPDEKYPGYLMSLNIPSTGSSKFQIFAGPYQKSILNAADAAMPNHPDFSAAQSSHGWFSMISVPFAKLLFICMNFFHFLTHSWGLSIILVTVVLRVMLYPLNAWSIKSMAKMQALAPKVSRIQEKHKGNPRAAQLEVVALYKQEKANPISGCLPLLIQMPFLFGMFDLLKSSFELRGASFLAGWPLISRWIPDLAAPDIAASWAYPVPFIGTQLHALPLLLAVVMFIQQKMSSTAPKDLTKMTDQQRQQRFMGNIMTVVFAVMFYKFPSGLNIYWLSSMGLGIVQQWYTTKKLAANTIRKV